MENNGQNGYTNPRLDRIETMLEMIAADHVKFSDEHNKLLTAQIVLTDRMDKLTIRMDRFSANMEELRQSQKEMGEAFDARLHALVMTVDDLVRSRREQ